MHLYNMYNKRLKITLLRNGITFMEDVRDRIHWAREFLNKRETTVMEELPEETVIPGMVYEMRSYGYDDDKIRSVLLDITGKRWSFDNSER